MNDQDRAAEFKSEIQRMRLKTGKTGGEKNLLALSIVFMLAGVVLAVISYFSSLNASEAMDQNELLILALVGLAVTIVGAAMFLRYSIGSFLRFWLLRLIHEIKDDD